MAIPYSHLTSSGASGLVRPSKKPRAQLFVPSESYHGPLVLYPEVWGSWNGGKVQTLLTNWDRHFASPVIYLPLAHLTGQEDAFVHNSHKNSKCFSEHQ